MFCGIASVAGLSTFRAKASVWDKKTILTVNQTIQVTDTVLDPGTYVLRLDETSPNRHIVRIFNDDQSHLIGTILAIPAERIEPTSDSVFTFWETPPGTAKAIREWFYPGEDIGEEFQYPKSLKQLAMATPAAQAQAPPPAPATTPDAVMAQPAPPTPPPEPAALAEEMTGESRDRLAEPVDASPAPPPAPVQTSASVDTPESPPAEQQPAELPKTASPYPMIGLSGAVMLGFAGLLRLKRSE
jgi:LPXTG-motif cell wall-anchored protein